MTCIIALRCDDGIVLVGDRKVRYGNGNVVSREIIFKDYHPFVIESSGDTMSFDDFRRQAKELAQRFLGIYNDALVFKHMPFDQRNISGITSRYSNPTAYPIIPHSHYLDGLKEIVRKKKGRYYAK